MALYIREYHQRDEEELQQLIHINYEEQYIIQKVKNHQYKAAFSALYENNLVGVIVVWNSNFHPNCDYFRILTHPLFSKFNVARELLSEVKPNLPLQTSIWETNARLQDFLMDSGFRLIRKTYMPRLYISDVKALLDTAVIELDNHRLITLADILLDDELIKKLIQSVKQVYEQTHLANPVAEMSLDKWKQLILGDVVRKASYVYLDTSGKEMIAFSFLHESDQGNTLELGWCGTTDKQSINMIPQLVLQQMRYAYEQGYEFLEGEFDTTSEYAMEVLRTIPFPPSPSWNTYQR